jgi:glycosyltransferase involved in cell wall biosynthesis
MLSQLPPPLHGASLMNQRTGASQVLAARYAVAQINITTAKGLEDIRQFGFGKIATVLRQATRLVSAVLRKRFSLCYITISSEGPALYKDSLLWCIAAVFIRKRVLHLHTRGIINANKDSRVKMSLIRFILSRSSVIVLSKFHGREVEGYTRDLHVLPNGIPVSSEAAGSVGAAASSGSAASGPLTLLFFSNLLAEKGIFQFLDTCALLLQQGVRFRAIVAGKELNVTLAEVQAGIAARALQGHVDVRGAVYGDDKTALLSEADVLLFPTFYAAESFPLVILEAFQFGIVPVCSDGASIPEMIDQGRDGFYYPYNDISSFAACIGSLAGDRDKLRTLAANGRSKFYRQFTFDLYEKNLVRILDTIVQQPI